MMTKIQNSAMAVKPSSLGMPACGHAFAPAFAGVAVAAGYGLGRVRVQGQVSLVDVTTDGRAIKAGIEAAGVPAWSPPTA